MQAPSHDASVAGLAEFVQSERGTVFTAWRKRIGSLPPSSGPSLLTHGASVLDWLAAALKAHARNEAPRSDLPGGESFSAPRAIAELALLTETIDQLRPLADDRSGRDSLHAVIETAIEHSLAKDRDESDRLRKRLRLATDVALVGCWELEPRSGKVTVDARSRELFGIAVDDGATTVAALTGQLHADDRARVSDGITQTLASGQAFMDECQILRPVDGSYRWVAVAADAHHGVGSATPRVLGIVHDISDRKRAEEEHARVVEELSRAVHISEMFVGILSHDLRNPLNAILGGAQLLAGDATDPKAVRLLGLVVSSGHRMGRMIEQLLDFTRTRLGEGIPLDRATVDLSDIAREVIDEGKAGSAASVFRLKSKGDTVGDWDRDRVFQVLSNLVGNAIQHGVSAEAVELVVDGSASESVMLSVHNQGLIPPHLLPVIFNPFRGTMQTRGQSRGLGLGLYVARQIALAHGGDLRVESTLTGTTFALELPRLDAGTRHSKADGVREEELAAFERMAAPPSTSAVTAQLFGSTPLHERVPLEHSDIVERYARLLDTALSRKAYRGQGEGFADDLRALAERLGDLGAGPREVTGVHARALRHAVRGATASKTQALLSEGRLLALEMMGNLASYYRRRSRVAVRGPGTGSGRA